MECPNCKTQMTDKDNLRECPVCGYFETKPDNPIVCPKCGSDDVTVIYGESKPRMKCNKCNKIFT